MSKENCPTQRLKSEKLLGDLVNYLGSPGNVLRESCMTNSVRLQNSDDGHNHFRTFHFAENKLSFGPESDEVPFKTEKRVNIENQDTSDSGSSRVPVEYVIHHIQESPTKHHVDPVSS